MENEENIEEQALEEEMEAQGSNGAEQRKRDKKAKKKSKKHKRNLKNEEDAKNDGIQGNPSDEVIETEQSDEVVSKIFCRMKEAMDMDAQAI